MSQSISNESYIYRPAKRPSPILITVDHASNHVPDWINQGALGIGEAEMKRHIAYDIGALGVARELAEIFDAHLLATQFSRLVIDPNRGEDDPTLIMRIYDRTIIPANRDLDHRARTKRLERLYHPYHAKIGDILESIQNEGATPVVIAIHSFTPQLKGKPPRPWHIGVLSADDRRLADPLINLFKKTGKIVVGDNEPYHGALKGDTMDRHGIHNGLPHALIELRNDLIETDTNQKIWAKHLADALTQALKKKDDYNG